MHRSLNATVFTNRATKRSLNSNVTFCTPVLPVRQCRLNSEYPDIHAFSRLDGRAFHRPKLGTYLFVNPKAASACGPSSKNLDLLVRL
jgi:hypothetical protein